MQLQDRLQTCQSTTCQLRVVSLQFNLEDEDAVLSETATKFCMLHWENGTPNVNLCQIWRLVRLLGLF
jgi:hypothetical protein